MSNNEIIRKLQLTQLQMLKYLNEECVTNDLHYTLDFGSLIGAIRHNGFIPWDDDSDVSMLLTDYRKLKKLQSKDGKQLYFLQDSKTDRECPYIFAKMRMNNTLMIDDCANTLQMHEGIWVDIFLLVNAGNTEKTRNLQYKLLNVYQSLRCRYRYRNDKINYQVNKAKKMVYSLPEIVCRMLDSIILKFIELLGSQKSPYYVNMCNGTYEETIVPKKYYDERCFHKFEDTELFIPVNYDEYLRRIYGEYMNPLKYGSHTDYEKIAFS